VTATMNRVEKTPTNPVNGWARFLACPHCKQPLSYNSDLLVCPTCGPVGKVEAGILRFTLTREDASITWYRNRGGAHFFERRRVPYTMSSLDTPQYHEYLASVRPAQSNATVVDVGAGDGRNTVPWLDWGFERVIATDAVFASLTRFRERLIANHPGWLDRVLLIECDARRLPLAADSVETALAIESLYYLNEDYPLGLVECRRILKSTGKLLLAERSWEGALLTRLLYDGVKAMLLLSDSRDMWDGTGDDLVRSRCFTEPELITILREHGLTPIECKGVSMIALVLGYLRREGKLKPADQELLPQVYALLQNLGDHGSIRRTHVVVAEKTLRV